MNILTLIVILTTFWLLYSLAIFRPPPHRATPPKFRTKLFIKNGVRFLSLHLSVSLVSFFHWERIYDFSALTQALNL